MLQSHFNRDGFLSGLSNQVNIISVLTHYYSKMAAWGRLAVADKLPLEAHQGSATDRIFPFRTCGGTQ